MICIVPSTEEDDSESEFDELHSILGVIDDFTDEDEAMECSKSIIPTVKGSAL